MTLAFVQGVPVTSAVRTPLISELPAASSHRAAQRAGTRAVDLDGLGHRWMLEDPARAARMLTSFWAGL